MKQILWERTGGREKPCTMKLFGKSSVTLHGPVSVLVDLCTFRQACSILAVCILYFLFGEKNEEKKQSRDQIENKVWESELRPEMPHQHYVDLTLKVAEVRSELYEKLHGGRI